MDGATRYSHWPWALEVTSNNRAGHCDPGGEPKARVEGPLEGAGVALWRGHALPRHGGRGRVRCDMLYGHAGNGSGQ